ncbi:MAG: DUF1127 domain-containing protein [Candidatus Pacebacteria bacterium]|nr:DUF1127 domain-containing protein [Candidatus Paceibacterota bacterium]
MANFIFAPLSNLLGDAIVSSTVVSARQNWVNRSFSGVNNKMQRLRAYRTLSNFNDRELADIGLTRGMIREAVYGERN